MGRWLERTLVVVLALALTVAVIALLSGGLAGGRDDPGIAIHRGPPPGVSYRDEGDRRLDAGAHHPRYDSDPPTSGAHVPATVARNGAPISDGALLQELALGNVVFLYSSAAPPKGLQAVADRVAPRFTTALAAHGQSVILARRPGLRTITAVAWDHLLRSDEAVALQNFAAYWLGRGAGTTVRRVVGSN